MIADRRIPIGDAVVDALLRDGSVRCRRDLVAVAVDLLGVAGAIAKLVEASRRDRVWLRHLDARALAPLPVGRATADDSISLSIRHQVAIAVASALGGPEGPEEYWVTPSGRDGRSWLVTIHSETRPRYEVCLSPDGLELYDRSMCVTAIRALTDIGPAALAALRDASERADSKIRSAAITGLARLGDPELADRLLGLLGGTSDPVLVDAALEALGKLLAPRAIVLVEDLLGMTEDGSDIHPVWGTCRSRPGWSDAIHRILVGIGADREVAAAIDA
ncbi:MAG TPA: HEAT repeat domain-containing protein, partial [Kofleriaceae bacterium]